MRADLGCDGGARRLHGIEVFLVLLAIRADGRKQAALVCASRRERVLPDDECVAGSALLLCLARQNGGRLGDVALRRGGERPRDTHLVRERLQMLGELLVRVADRVEIVELLDHVCEAVRLEEDVELARVRGLVELDQARFEPVDGDLVIVPQQVVALRLLFVPFLQPRQVGAMSGEVLLERRDFGGQRADASLKRGDLRRRARDLRREHAFFVLGLRDLSLKACDLRIEALLLLPDRLAKRRRDAENHADGEEEGEQGKATEIAQEISVSPGTRTSLRARAAARFAEVPCFTGQMRFGQVRTVQDFFTLLVLVRAVFAFARGAGPASGSEVGGCGGGSRPTAGSGTRAGSGADSICSVGRTPA